MKIKTTLIFLAIAVLFVVGVFKAESLMKPWAGTTAPVKVAAPDFLKNISSFSLRDYKGDPLSITQAQLEEPQRLVVHFWASWCAPCVNEVPELIAYSKKHPTVKFVIVSVDDYQDDIGKFLKSFPDFNSAGYYKIWDGDKKMTRLFNVDRLPMSIIFDKSQPEPQFFRSVVDWKRLD
jgi:cytochrome c biogenesis protein CcmG, thiol:disulfide interchange protein DsbE